MPDLELLGCRTRPLLSYLKALGVLRHVGAVDPEARLAWRRGGHAVLRSRFDDEALVTYFLEEYGPSPITSPWNGNSGYHPKDKSSKALLERIGATTDPRLERLRVAIARVRALIATLPVSDKPEKPTDDKVWKQSLLSNWRAVADDDVLDWLDAAMTLNDDGQAMNPLLGTGGNDGRLEFSTTFHAALVQCLPLAFGGSSAGTEGSGAQLEGALHDRGRPPLWSAPVGMFSPGAAGLPNSSSSTREAWGVNPWDFVLMLEGAMLFGGGVARRLATGAASFPFTITGGGTTRIGRSLDQAADGSARGETWLPVWNRFASLAAVRRLLAEGRAQDDRSQARAGRTLERAAASIGVDRGVVAFERMVHAQRFSRMYIAVPAGRVDVRPSRQVEILRAADAWLDRARRLDVPNVLLAVGRVDRAAQEVTRHGPQGVESWLLALADLQILVGRNPDARKDNSGIRPLADLPAAIAAAIHTEARGAPEWELAQALAAVGRVATPDGDRTGEEISLRRLLEPVAPEGPRRYRWKGERGSGRGVSLRQPIEMLVALARARASMPSSPDRHCAGLGAVLAFLSGDTDDHRLVRLAFALSLCRPAPVVARLGDSHAPTSRLYALGRLVAGTQPLVRRDGPSAHVVPEAGVVSALAAGNVAAARRLAVGRLRSTEGLRPFASFVDVSAGADPRRIAAALAVPLNTEGRESLARTVLWPAGPLSAGAREGAAS